MMPELSELRDVRDDWTGVTSTKERKRRQNRLHQRAYRRRKREEQKPGSNTELSILSSGQRSFSFHANPICEGTVLLTSPASVAHIQAFARAAYEDYTLQRYRPSYLAALIRLNVLNAVSQNAVALRIPAEGLCDDRALSPFSFIGPRLGSSPAPPSSAPSNLQPTQLQREMVHHPWIDLFPWPQVRDNILRGVAADVFDEDHLCTDIMEVRNEQPHLMVWGNPSDVRAWEVSEFFLCKWGFLVHNCPELLQASNDWRHRRGMGRLALARES